MLRLLPFILTIFATSLVLSGCGASRKISKVGLRELSSEESGANRDRVSELRAKIQNIDHVAKACPGEVRNHFVSLAGVKVAPPSCPAGFVEKVQIALPLLNMEEQSVVEEITTMQCRNLVDAKRDGDLRRFAESFENGGPIGRRRSQGASEGDDDLKDDIEKLTNLRNALNEILSVNIPFERWVIRNGYYALPEGDLGYYYSLIVENNCRVTGDLVDDGFHALAALEDLRRLLPEGDTQKNLKNFLDGLHKFVGKQMGDFFN